MSESSTLLLTTKIAKAGEQSVVGFLVQPPNKMTSASSAFSTLKTADYRAVRRWLLDTIARGQMPRDITLNLVNRKPPVKDRSDSGFLFCGPKAPGHYCFTGNRKLQIIGKLDVGFLFQALVDQMSQCVALPLAAKKKKKKCKSWTGQVSGHCFQTNH